MYDFLANVNFTFASDCRQKLSENALFRESDSFSFMRTENLRLFQ